MEGRADREVTTTTKTTIVSRRIVTSLVNNACRRYLPTLRFVLRHPVLRIDDNDDEDEDDEDSNENIDEDEDILDLDDDDDNDDDKDEGRQ